MKKIDVDNFDKIKYTLHSKVQIKLDKKYIKVFLNNNLFLKQPMIKGKSKNYNFFLVLFIINRFGLVNFKNK